LPGGYHSAKSKGSAARIIGIGDRAFIAVDSESHPARQRFSAAHELGYWMLDRGKLASFVCSEKKFVNDRTGDNPEHRANHCAADLLLPSFMFEPFAKNKEITFQAVRELCSLFQTGITATTICLVELGSFPAIIVCTSKQAPMAVSRS
jgi:Zn-dependent peptidase ImmA (M78 family)